MKKYYVLPVLLILAITFTLIVQAENKITEAPVVVQGYDSEAQENDAKSSSDKGDEFHRKGKKAKKGNNKGDGSIREGNVSRLLIDSRGRANGLLLDTGTIVTFPKHMSDQLVTAVKLGDAVEVRGKSEGANGIKAYAITNTRNNQSLIVQPKPKGRVKLPKHVQDTGLQSMDAQGKIEYLRYGKRGEINGAILANGTILRFSREVSSQFTPSLEIGQSISAFGYGTKNQYGQSFEATELGLITE